jgi:hypothetical protein
MTTTLEDQISNNKQQIVEIFNQNVKGHEILLDGKNSKHCGMYDGNNRNYSQFRAPASFWDELIIEEY